MSEMERLQRELAALQEQGAELDAQREPGTDLIRVGSPEALESQMRQTQEGIRRQEVLIKAKVAEIQAFAEQQRVELERAARAAERALEPVQAALREVGEQIKTIGLYLGTGERITQLSEGNAAPLGTTVTVRQMILRMDEEVAAAAESGGLDYRNMAEFDKWLLESPDHLAQVLPELKGVVCFTPRDPARSKRDTRKMMGPNPDATMYWLIRNGDRLWRMTTDFQVQDKLVPGPGWLEALFTRDGKPIRPGSMDWDRAQEAANEAERAYFRVQVILEGLLHRTPVFEPLPVQGMSFMDEEHHEAGRLAFILDAEAALGDGSYESFPAWQRRLNAQLRPGLRIVGEFNSYEGGFRGERYDGQWGPHGNRRLYPSGASYPDDGVIYELERVQGGKLGFRYERTDTVFRGWREDSGNAKVRASCRVKPSDDWIIPYDLATEEELRSFLHRRTERKHYVGMFPVIKAALRAKREEREQEEPFRVMLAGVLARENGVSVGEAEQALPGLVDWFKLTNKYHRPLLHRVRTTGKGGEGLPEDRAQEMAAKAVRLITAEHARRLKIERSKPNERLVAELRDGLWRTDQNRWLTNAAVMVGRRRSDGKYVVVVPERSDENVYATVIVWGSRKGLDEMSHWQVITKRQAAAWQVLWAHERWDEWELDADRRKHLTDGELEQLMAQLREAAASGDADCDPGTPVLGFTVERRYGVVELCAYLLTEEPVLPSEEHPLSERGHQGKVEVRSRAWKRQADGSVSFYRETWTTGWRHGGSRWNRAKWHDDVQDLGGDPWAKGVRVLWCDRSLIDQLRVRFQEYSHASGRVAALNQEEFNLERAIDRAWHAAWWEDRRQEFVAEYGKPELWDGQRKVIQDQLDRGRRDEPDTPEGIEALVRPFVEAGEADRLWGRSVADVLAEAIDRGWVTPGDDGLDVSLLLLRFDRKAPRKDKYDTFDQGVEDVHATATYDADATVAVAGELTAGEPEDAEVVE
jgi:hypothetical protein